MIDFPSNPTQGQQFQASGVTWTWDGSKWTASGLNVAYLPLTGGSLIGPLILAADPTIALGAATKQYVDGNVNSARWGDNRIINGDMRIDQRNNGAAGTAPFYTVDRWQYMASQTLKGNWQRNLGPPSSMPREFAYCFGFQSTSSYALLASDFFGFYQIIEADMITDFGWSGANAQPVTLSFLAMSSLTGTFSGAIRNATGSGPAWTVSRSYPFTFSLPTANTWTKIVVTIPGDLGGPWQLNGNAAGATVTFDFGAGATYRAPAGAWAAGNYVGVTGAQSVVSTNGAAFYVTGVKLEIGSVATLYNRQSLAKSLADCQRYYESGLSGFVGNTTQGQTPGVWTQFQVMKRVTPTMTTAISYNSGGGWSGPLATDVAQNGFMGKLTAPVSGVGYFFNTFTADAEL